MASRLLIFFSFFHVLCLVLVLVDVDVDVAVAVTVADAVVHITMSRSYALTYSG